MNIAIEILTRTPNTKDMTSYLSILSTAALCSALAQAQCLTAPTGSNVTLVNWDASSGFASTWGFRDEGLVVIPLTAFANFPMAGAVGNLNTLMVQSNCEVYLADSTLGLSAPVGGSLYSTDSLLEMRGNVAAGTARIVALGEDVEDSIVSGAVWSCKVDQSVSGQVRIVWTDIARLGSATDRFSVSMTLFASGAVEFSYSSFPAGFGATVFAGVSIGNLVGTASTPSSDLTALPDSGTLGLLYENFTPATFDLADKTLLITPNGTGGYTSVVTCDVPAAKHTSYGSGCYSYSSSGSLAQLFADQTATRTAMNGNGVTFTRTASGYIATWVPGATFVAPTGGATTLTFADVDDGNVAITPSTPIPVPGGVAATWNVSVNGILTAAATANNPIDYIPSLASLASNTLAPNLGFYAWRDFLLNDTVSNGTITREETGGVLYVTWNAVEAYLTGTVNPSTWQFQVNMTTGDVSIVVASWDPSTNTNDTLIGCSLAGPSPTPTSTVLSTGLPKSLTPTTVTLNPLTLSASPAPIINGAPVTWTTTNIPEFAPGAATYASLLYASFGQDLPGLDLNIIGAPGCKLHLGGLDQQLAAGFTATSTSTFSTPIPGFVPPGLTVFFQAYALFDPAFPLPNGQNSFGLLSSNGIASLAQTF